MATRNKLTTDDTRCVLLAVSKAGFYCPRRTICKVMMKKENGTKVSIFLGYIETKGCNICSYNFYYVRLHYDDCYYAD